jgi:shikimate dehydrogenase/3-dehydroquinate dehydratase type I
VMMTLVVASLVERSIAGVARSSRKAFAAGADAVELRLDHLEGLGRGSSMLEEARRAIDGPAIATLRSVGEGGLSRAKEAQRARVLERVMESGFEYIDLELASDRRLLERLREARSSTKVIGSIHFSRPATRAEIKNRLERACALADIGKVAAPCDHAGHAVAIADAGLEFSDRGVDFALMGMGAQGQLTRACAKGLGSGLVYACLSGSPAAPGQLDVALQSSLVRDGAVVLGLIGHPVSHSVSKPMHEAALRSAGLTGVYLPLDVPAWHMGERFVSTLFEIGFSGLNVTIPHKERASRICDSKGVSASATGAVNTLVRRDGRIVGENTDVSGLSRLIESKKVSLDGGDSLVIGAGGAARAACKVLLDEGSEVTVAARRVERARAVARSFSAKAVALSKVSARKGIYDVVINATPMGTRGTSLEKAVIPAGVLAGRPVFIDLVYNPPSTRSMKLARSKGCRTYGGLEMLVGQGAEAFRIWTGREPDTGSMRQAARRALR